MPKFQGVDYYSLDELLSQDEILVRNTVREFVDEHVLPVIEKHYIAGTFPMDLIPKMAELGLFGPTLPAKYGCAEMNNVAYGLMMQELERALRSDRAPSKTLAFNEFGLIAITRKRVRQSLEKVLCQPCPYCTGTGMVKSLETLCYEIQEEARKMARSIDAPELTIRAHPEVAKALKSRESGLLRELEVQTGKNIIIQPDQTLHMDQYNIF